MALFVARARIKLIHQWPNNVMRDGAKWFLNAWSIIHMLCSQASSERILGLKGLDTFARLSWYTSPSTIKTIDLLVFKTHEMVFFLQWFENSRNIEQYNALLNTRTVLTNLCIVLYYINKWIMIWKKQVWLVVFQNYRLYLKTIFQAFYGYIWKTNCRVSFCAVHLRSNAVLIKSHYE